MFRKIHIFLLLFLFGLFTQAQNINPGPDIIYNNIELASIKVTMDTADKAFLMDKANVSSETYLEAVVHFVNSELDSTLTGAGIRLRGNTSRGHPKRSFKLKFKEFGGEKFYGYKKFNLKAENNDPSLCREHFSLETYRLANVPAARSHHAKLFINGEYMGVYLNVEQIDDEFALRRFNDDEGNLYKCLWGSSLEDDGQIFNNTIYELKTNETENDRSKLKHFVEVLNKTSDSELEKEISKLIDPDQVMMFLAVEAILGHWDGHAYNKNNFYLYENGTTGLIDFIPYDVDNTFGIDWIGGDWGEQDLLDWADHNQPRPLVDRLMNIPSFYKKYTTSLTTVLDSIFTEAILFPKFDSNKNLLNSAVMSDVYYPLTFGYQYSDFADSHVKKVVKHAPYGLRPYVSTRITSGRQQLRPVSVPELAKTNVFFYPNPSVDGSLTLTGGFENLEMFSLTGRSIPLQINRVNYRHAKIHPMNSLKSGIYLISIDGAFSKLLIE